MTILDDFDAVADEARNRLAEIKNYADEFLLEATADMTALEAQATTLLALADGLTADPAYDSSPDLDLTALPSASPPSYQSEGPTHADLDDALKTQHAVAAYSFTNTSYGDGQVGAAASARLSALLGGATIVPTAIWSDIISRAEAKLAEAKVDAELAAAETSANLGYELPGPRLLEGLTLAWDGHDEALVDNAIKGAIDEVKERQSDLWKAVENGVIFEQLWISHHHQMQSRALQSAIDAFEHGLNENDKILLGNDQTLKVFAEKNRQVAGRLLEETKLYQARIAEAEAANRESMVQLAFSRVALKHGLADEKTRVTARLLQAKLVEKITDTLQKVAEMMAAMAQGAIAASDVSLGASTGYNYRGYRNNEV